MNKAGLKKVRKTVRGKRGSVQRTYWVKANPKKAGKARLRAAANQQPQPSFMQRHGSKIAAAAALAFAAHRGAKYVGQVARGEHGGSSPLAGAIRGASMAHYESRANNDKLTTRAQNMFRRAREGYAANRADYKAPTMRERFTNTRRGIGADLAHHLTERGGHAAADYIAHRAGSTIGGMFGGPLGSYIGGEIGNFVVNRYGSERISRAAHNLSERLRR